MSNGAIAGATAGTTAAAAAAAIARAIKASGAIVYIEPSDFRKIVQTCDAPLVVYAYGGFFKKTYQYLMSYKGLFLYTKCAHEIPLPPDTETILSKKIWIPG